MIMTNMDIDTIGPSEDAESMEGDLIYSDEESSTSGLGLEDVE